MDHFLQAYISFHIPLWALNLRSTHLEKSGTPKRSPVTITTKGKEKLVIHNHPLLHISGNGNQKKVTNVHYSNEENMLQHENRLQKMEFEILLGYIMWSHIQLPTVCRNLLPPSAGQKTESSVAGSPQYQLPHYMMPSPLWPQCTPLSLLISSIFM